MSSSTRFRIPGPLLVVVLVVSVLGFYIVLLGIRGVTLLGDPRWVVKGLGLGIVLLPVVGVAIVVEELRFGRAAQRLGQVLDDAGEPAPPAGDPQRVFDVRRTEVEQAPDDWRAWYRLGVAYGAAGDVGRGRRAVRKAIALEARTPTPTPTSRPGPTPTRVPGTSDPDH
jgi:hypothetical protein